MVKKIGCMGCVRCIRCIRCIGAFAVLLLLPALAAAQSFPKPTGRVNDFANVIDAATEAEIDRMIDQLERKTSSEIAVATVMSLDGMSIEEYANKLFKEWGVGQAKQDNGVLVLVAPTQREMRIEVGYGLEGVLPDGLAGEVIRDQFTPKFKNRDFSGGIKDGVTRLVGIVEKHQVLTPEEIAKLNDAGLPDDDLPMWTVVLFSGAFASIRFWMIGAGIRTKAVFNTLFGGMLGIVPFLLSLIFMPGLTLMTLVPMAIIATWIGYRMGENEAVQTAFRGSGSSSSSGWVKGSSGSSSSSSSGSSSSSSNYGGGRSGGGGASGKW